MYYRGAQAAVLVYDITRWQSFREIETWVQELKQSASDDLVMCLLGNKVDLRQADSVGAQVS
jgi:GTPase SAR1 family protein